MYHYILLRKTSPESTPSERAKCWKQVLAVACSHIKMFYPIDTLIILRTSKSSLFTWCYNWGLSTSTLSFHISPLPALTQMPCTGRWVTGVHTDTVPSRISPETLVHTRGGWWGYLNPDPRRQKTSQFGDYEEHNTQHSGFHISAPHSSLHCRHVGHTRGKDERVVSSRPSDFKLECVWRAWWLTRLI